MMTLERRHDLITVLKPHFLPKRLHSTKSYFFGSWFTSFSRVLPTSRVGYPADKPIESVVYCLSILIIFVTVDPTPNKPMAARTATDHQRLRETHELHLLNQTGQPQPRGRGLGQPVVKPPSSSSMPSAGPPVSQQPSQNGGDETAFSLPEVMIIFLNCNL